MCSVRLFLAATAVMGALLVSTFEVSAKPRAVQQPYRGQRIVNNILLQQQVKRVQLRRKIRHHAGVSGTVVSIHHNKQAPGTGTIKLAVHHHTRNKNAQKANLAKAVKQPIRRAALAMGVQKQKKTHSVTIHFARGTKFAITVKGVFQGKAQVKTVGSGKAKTKVVFPGKLKLETRNLPSSPRIVQKGHYLKISLHDQQHQNAREVHIISPSAMANNIKK
jgi:hypothetical protein